MRDPNPGVQKHELALHTSIPWLQRRTSDERLPKLEITLCCLVGLLAGENLLVVPPSTFLPLRSRATVVRH